MAAAYHHGSVIMKQKYRHKQNDINDISMGMPFLRKVSEVMIGEKAGRKVSVDEMMVVMNEDGGRGDNQWRQYGVSVSNATKPNI